MKRKWDLSLKLSETEGEVDPRLRSLTIQSPREPTRSSGTVPVPDGSVHETPSSRATMGAKPAKAAQRERGRAWRRASDIAAASG